MQKGSRRVPSEEELSKDRTWSAQMQERARDMGRNRKRKNPRLYTGLDKCPRCGSNEAEKRKFTKGFWYCCETIVGAPEPYENSSVVVQYLSNLVRNAADTGRIKCVAPNKASLPWSSDDRLDLAE